ncbi:MAG: Verru_Chthon cassette protein B [Chthoniobacteraceae bacterium]
MTPPPSSVRQRKASGFTLIEVAIAVGILAVALVALLGLLPGGMTNFRKAMDTSITAQIAQRILLDMQQADFAQVIDAPAGTDSIPVGYTFTAPTRASQQFRYFDEQGGELIPPNNGTTLTATQKLALVYQVNIRVMPTASLPADGNAVKEDVAQVTVQVARNPGNKTIPVSRGGPSDTNTYYRNLYDPTSDVVKKRGVQIFTYSALIGKNQG